jgi:S1-C subfamily serine protease
MSLRLLHLCVGLCLVLGSALDRVSQDKKPDEKKSDGQVVVKEGTEVSLTPVEVKLSDNPGADGRYTVTVKAKDATKVKMPAQAYYLGFTPKAEAPKGGGLEIAEVVGGGPLATMRTEPKKDEGAWEAEAGDVITHVNGYAVNTLEELLVALATAKDKNDVPIVLKDVRTGELTAFYVTAGKK